MSKTIAINGVGMQVQSTEFEPINIEKFCTLKMVHDLGNLERLSGFIKDLSTIFNKGKALFMDITHGGFLALECKDAYDNITLTVDNKCKEDVAANIMNYDKLTIVESVDVVDAFDLIFCQNVPCDFAGAQAIIISRATKALDCAYTYNYNFAPTLEKVKSPFNLDEYKVYIPDRLHESFQKEFSYYIEHGFLNYNNLVHYTMIVKNAGDILEEVLTENLPIIDKWTILDTGSTDNTIDIINKVLVGKKKGTLYQEPFINFRESRNRCLDLASQCVEPCKYLLMLDDTYVIKGSLREFLDTTRGDQFSKSFSLYVSSYDMVYVSNRLTKTKNKLRYKHLLHEIIQEEDNINVCITKDEGEIIDKPSEYMHKRSNDRCEYDIEMLFRMIEEGDDVPRQLYYVAKSYTTLENYEKALEYYLKRTEYKSGYIQELVDSYFEAARLCEFKLNKDWDTCLSLYEKAYELDPTRPDASYFIGHHYLSSNPPLAYKYMKRAFEIPFNKGQYGLKPTLYYHFLPMFLANLCYTMKNYTLGFDATETYLNSDVNMKDTPEYALMTNWNKIYNHILKLKVLDFNSHRPYLAVIVPDSRYKWCGDNISEGHIEKRESCIAQLCRNIKTHNVIVFCDCSKREICDGVEYRDISEIYDFLTYTYVDTVLLSNGSEYISMVSKANPKTKIYMIPHGLVSGQTIIPLVLNGVLCLTEWHRENFLKSYPSFKDKTKLLNFGVDINTSSFNKIKNRFIFNAGPNKDLLILLYMWPKIITRYPHATLEIFSQIESSYTAKCDLKSIYNLIQVYTRTGMGVIYNKEVMSDKELYKGLCNAEIFFYPTEWKDTTCVEILQAQATKTLCVCSNIEAAVDMLSDNKGLMLQEGDVYSAEWQDYALNELFTLMDNLKRRDAMIDNAFEYAKTRSWRTCAKNLEVQLTQTSPAMITEYFS